MRTLSVLAAVLMLGAPGVASAGPSRDHRGDALASALPSPQAMEAAGAALSRLVDALLDVRIGPLAEAVDPTGRNDPRRRDETLGERAARDDPYFRERMHESIGEAAQGISEMAARAAALAPVLRDTMDELESRIDEAVEERSHRRD